MTDKKQLLVTGANGLLGSHIVDNYSAEYQIHAIVRKIPKNRVDGVTYHEIDFSENWNADSLPQNIDIICHLAQSNNFRDFPDKAIDIFNVNVATAAKLLDFAYKIDVSNFILASSGGVYAHAPHAFHENSKIAETHELGYYLGSKRCSEILGSNYFELMNVSILRFFFIYGAKQKRSMLLPRLVDNVQEGKPITLAGREGIKINPVHVSDAAKAVIACTNRKSSETFNIAGPKIYSLKEIANIIGDIVGKKPIFEYSKDEPQNIVADISAMKEKLYIPEVKLKDGLWEMI